MDGRRQNHRFPSRIVYQQQEASIRRDNARFKYSCQQSATPACEEEILFRKSGTLAGVPRRDSPGDFQGAKFAEQVKPAASFNFGFHIIYPKHGCKLREASFPGQKLVGVPSQPSVDILRAQRQRRSRSVSASASRSCGEQQRNW